MGSDEMRNMDLLRLSKLDSVLMDLISEEDCSTIEHPGIGWVRKKAGGSSRRVVKAGGYRVGGGCGIIKRKRGGRSEKWWRSILFLVLVNLCVIISSASYYYGASSEEVTAFLYGHGQWNTSWKFPALVALCPDYRQPGPLKHSVWLHLHLKANKELIRQGVPSGFWFSGKVNFFFLPRLSAWGRMPVLLYQHFSQFPCSQCVSIYQAIFFGKQ